ncbi:MAG: hypothetical protein EXS05_10300 [Planctomycetaceae bacterium]|nr:hypothetical protein [Planctomycetaceae bacterium]
MIPAHLQFSFESAVVGLMGIAFLAVTVWLFLAARRREFIGGRMLMAAGGLGIAMAAIVWMLPHWFLSDSRGPQMLLLMGVSSLALAPLAAGPLAVTWNRHR